MRLKIEIVLMPRIQRECNVVQQLLQRELLLVRSPYRLSLQILRKLVCDEGSTFVKVWETHSRQPILCEDGKLYFNNYQTCFTLTGCDGLPSELYKLPVRPKTKKIEDAVVYSGPVTKLMSEASTYKSFFLALTKDNWLISYNNLTGSELQTIYLGPTTRYKFKHVEWETHGEHIVVTSIQNQAPTEIQGTRPRVLVAIALLTVFPLEFVALLEIDRMVFGSKCNHVNVSEGLLILGYGSATNGTVRLYNFRQIIEDGMLFTAKLNEVCKEFDNQRVGVYPFGLPLNCKITVTPPILFQIKCSDYNLHIGGHPWHYVTTPPRKDGVFQVSSLSDNVVAEGGYLDFPNMSTEPDSIAFHPDDSGRLVYNAAHSVRFFKLFENSKGVMALEESITITMEENDENIQQTPSQRRMQRTVKKKFNLDTIMASEKSILSDDYENELDLYAVMGFNPRAKDCIGKISLYDNQTGKKIKTISLNMKTDELSDYTLTMDLETFILLVKNKTSVYSCYIYRLQSFTPEMQEMKEKADRKHRKKKS